MLTILGIPAEPVLRRSEEGALMTWNMRDQIDN